MQAIHQLVAGYSSGDAITNEARTLQTIFRGWGCPSEIYCEPRRILPELRGEVRDVADCRADLRPEDIVLLHLSTGSIVNEVFPELPGRKALLYHNITPPDYFRGLQEEIARVLERGREQARALAGIAEVVMADSAFNASELRDWGYGEAAVLPLVLDLPGLCGQRPNRSVLRQFDDDKVNVLFVGRCVPNKRLEDGLAAFHYFQKFVQPRSRFLLVGTHAGLEQYHALLVTQIREMDLRDVVTTGSVRPDELRAYYEVADAFLCMSEHEGFCIPLLEAMACEVPVLAYAAAAVPDTMDGAGVLFREKRHDLVAEMLGRLTGDAAFRASILAGQQARIERFNRRDAAAEIRGHLAPLLAV